VALVAQVRCIAPCMRAELSAFDALARWRISIRSRGIDRYRGVSQNERSEGNAVSRLISIASEALNVKMPLASDVRQSDWPTFAPNYDYFTDIRGKQTGIRSPISEMRNLGTCRPSQTSRSPSPDSLLPPSLLPRNLCRFCRILAGESRSAPLAHVGAGAHCAPL